MEQMRYSPTPKRFDFEAEVPCLDFANTADWHASEHPEEELLSYADLVDWGEEAGLIDAAEAGRLTQLAREQPENAGKWLAEAIALREAIYRIFAAAGHQQPIPPADIDILNQFWRQAAQAMRMVALGDKIQWEWDTREDDLGRVLWPVARSAVELLGSEQRQRVGQCEDDRGCGYLYLDTSRNRSRRWCSMESCGNRAKAYRHYSRAKKAQ